MEDKKWKYTISFLREFLKNGEEHGNVGFIPLYRKNGITTYSGFGTIEHPIKTRNYISMMYNPYFEESVIKYQPSSSYKFIMLDLNPINLINPIIEITKLKNNQNDNDNKI